MNRPIITKETLKELRGRLLSEQNARNQEKQSHDALIVSHGDICQEDSYIDNDNVDELEIEM